MWYRFSIYTGDINSPQVESVGEGVTGVKPVSSPYGMV